MNVLLLGATGMLGQEVFAELQARGHTVAAPTRLELNLTGKLSSRMVQGMDRVINCAAFTAVDRAQEDEEQDAVIDLNAKLPAWLIGECDAWHKVPLIHVSTDYVFSGDASKPYIELDETSPINFYGLSKWIGERVILDQVGVRSLVFRTAWLFGPGGNCFPKTMIRRRSENQPTRVVADQFGSPTSAIALAKQIVQAIELDIEPGLYHAAGPEGMSWHEFATRIWREYERFYGLEAQEIEPITTDQYPTPARRPRYTVLDSSKLVRAGVSPMPPLEESIREFVQKVAPGFPPQ